MKEIYMLSKNISYSKKYLFVQTFFENIKFSEQLDTYSATYDWKIVLIN